MQAHGAFDDQPRMPQLALPPGHAARSMHVAQLCAQSEFHTFPGNTPRPKLRVCIPEITPKFEAVHLLLKKKQTGRGGGGSSRQAVACR